MLNYIYNECKRIVIKKKILIIIALIVSLAAAIGIAIYVKTDTLDRQIDSFKDSIEYYKKVETAENKESIQKQIDNCNLQIEIIKEEKDEIDNYDINKIDDKINNLKHTTITDDNRTSIDHQLKMLNYYKDNGISKANLTANGVGGFNSFIGAIMPVLVIIFSIILFSDIISGEFSSRAIKMIFSRSMSKEKILAGKYIAANIIILILETIINVISMIIFALICGIADYKAPVVKNTQYVLDTSRVLLQDHPQMKYLNVTLTSNIKLTFMIMAILFLFSITTVSITIFISNLSKNILATAFINVGAYLFAAFFYIKYFMSGNYIQKYEYGKVFKFVPITYIDIMDSIQGRVSYNLNTNLVSVKFIIAVLLMWCIVMYLLSCILFRKKRV